MITTPTPAAPGSPTPRQPAVAQSAFRRLLADVTEAARILPPNWPLRDFIAVNPLGGLTEKPFAEAAETAGILLGARALPPETWLRAAWRRGRITDADLRAALASHAPTALDGPAISLSGRRLEPETVLLAELHHGLLPPHPQRTNRTLLERLDPQAAALLETHIITYLAAYLDDGQASWPMPGRHLGLYAAWHALAPHTPHLPRTARARLRHLADQPEQALLNALDELGVPEAERMGYLQAHLACLPGWAARLRGHAEQHADAASDLVGYLALRTGVEAALLAPRFPYGTAYIAAAPCRNAGPRQPTPAQRAAHLMPHLGITAYGRNAQDRLAGLLALLPFTRRALVWLEAYEGHYRDRLLTALNRPLTHQQDGDRPVAQVVCCIDPRSEGLRRHLEQQGAYQTLGFAGFFAVALRFSDLAGGAPRTHCPALASPQHDLTERPAPGHHSRAGRHLAGRQVLAAAAQAWRTAKHHPAAPFALADATGWAAGPLAAARTLAPRATTHALRRITRRLTPPAVTDITIDNLTRDQRLHTARTVLTLMGLTQDFARLVVFVGHAARTTNNPYQAALDCGACGGHPGGPNARAAAALLNHAQVRADLAEHGIAIPGTTHFLAAEHDTTTDHVTLLDTHLLPATHQTDAARLTADLERAGTQLAAERCTVLPAAPTRPGPRLARRHVATRAADWAQPFPEWGLAGNAALVIAPRALTRGLDLERRVFLHDYDHTRDGDGTVLENILTAPLVVAQWINSQYYFATVDLHTFGAGTKALHNITGAGQGVLAGATSDLQAGLPWQSLSDGSQLRHEPQRLLTLVHAPLDRLDTLIARHQILRHLIGHGWITLAARTHTHQPWHRRGPDGWQPWSPSGTLSGTAPA
ncbi:DUF2309 domain-containing protein [Streptomyces sp. NPDC020490]|uniref:DUF2309 domain-containing protein n=1 Tax=Streptomyces sp. NPDC020490 TaxID=3365078 RepID=UPI0037ACD353